MEDVVLVETEGMALEVVEASEEDVVEEAEAGREMIELTEMTEWTEMTEEMWGIETEIDSRYIIPAI